MHQRSLLYYMSVLAQAVIKLLTSKVLKPTPLSNWSYHKDIYCNLSMKPFKEVIATIQQFLSDTFNLKHYWSLRWKRSQVYHILGFVLNSCNNKRYPIHTVIKIAITHTHTHTHNTHTHTQKHTSTDITHTTSVLYPSVKHVI